MRSRSLEQLEMHLTAARSDVVALTNERDTLRAERDHAIEQAESSWKAMMAALELRNMDEGIVRTMRRVMQTEMTWLKVLRHRVKDVRRDDLTRTITNLQAGLDGIDPYLEEDDP